MIVSLAAAPLACERKKPASSPESIEFRGPLPATLPEVLTQENVRATCKSMDRFFVDLGKNKAKERLLQVTYSDFPKVEAPKEPVYILPYHGVHVPIPDRPYRFSLSYNSVKRQFGLIFVSRSENGILVLDRMVGEETMGDVFQKVGEPVTDARQEYTRKLFGKLPNLFDIHDLGFQITPQTYRCDQANFLRAVRDLAVFTIKILSPYLEYTAHRGVGLKDSILDQGRSADDSYHFNYSYRSGQRFYSLGCTTQGSSLFEAARGLLPFVSESVPPRLASKPLPLLGQELVKLANNPTPGLARSILARDWGKEAPARIASEIRRYLQQADAPSAPK
jgi:hypothetical protein